MNNYSLKSQGKAIQRSLENFILGVQVGICVLTCLFLHPEVNYGFYLDLEAGEISLSFEDQIRM